MSKRKFNIGDKVVIAPKYKNRYNSITTVGEIISISSTGDRAAYLVKFEDKIPEFTLYSYELVFADMHALADHCRKDLITHEKFYKGDIIRLVGTEKVGFVVEILEPLCLYKIFTDEYQICNIYAIEHASERDLLAYQRNICYNVDTSKATKCKYCGEPFDEDFIESSEESGACEYCVDQRKKMPKIHMRKSIAVDLKDFSIYGKDGDWLEVTEWTNGDGIDIDIHYSSDHEEDNKHFVLSYDELGVVMNIVNKFGYLPTIYTTKEKEN